MNPKSLSESGTTVPDSFEQLVQRISDLAEKLKTTRDPYTRRNLLFEMTLVISELNKLVDVQTRKQSLE
jgi:hypothetical protein